MWYKDWFKDSNYLVVYEHRDESEAEQALDLIERVTGVDRSCRVLDLACGSGRHALAFARRGYSDVTGVDLSPTLLAEAEKNAERETLSVRFIESDMRRLPEERFDLVVNLFTSFGYFAEDRENEEVISTVGAAITSNGWFVLDFFNCKWVRTHLVAHDDRILPDGGRVESLRWIENGRVEKRLILRRGEEAAEYVESVRLFDRGDLEAMFERANLSVEHVLGNYDGSAFNEDRSPRLILFGRKR